MNEATAAVHAEIVKREINVTMLRQGASGTSFIWEGTWLTATQYQSNDVVFHDGSSYIAILTHTSGATSEPGVGATWQTYWNLMAQEGGGVSSVSWGDIIGTLADQTDLQGALDAKQNLLGFTPENVANKATSTSLGVSDTLYPSQNAVKQYVDTGLATKENSFTKGSIIQGTGVTLTGTLTNRLVGVGDVTINASGSASSEWGDITGTLSDQTDLQSALDAKVPTSRTINGQALTSNITLTTADIADSLNKRYVTDAQLVVIGNTSGTNTGDQTLTSLGVTAFAQTLLDDADAATARTTLGLTAGGSGDIWVEKAGDTMTGNLTMQSQDATNGTVRINLETYERAVSPNHYSELLRLDWKEDDSKPTIAFRDENGLSHAWLMAHKFLQVVDANDRKTFVDADVNTTTDVITITAHGFATQDPVWFYSTATLPTGIALSNRYYVRALSSDTLSIYRSASDANTDTGRINFTAATGGGTHTIDGNNYHNHIAIEVKNQSDDTLNSKFEVELDQDNPFIRALSYFQVKGFPMYITGGNSDNKDIFMGIDETAVYRRFSLRVNNTTESGSNVGSDFQIVRFTDAGVAIDSPLTITRSNALATFSGNITSTSNTILVDSSTTATLAADRGNTTSFASIVVRTAGTDQWTIGLRNDSTNKLYIRDNINGLALLDFTQNGETVFNEGGDADLDVRIEGDTNANLLFTDASTDRVGVGTNTPSALLDVNGVARMTTLNIAGTDVTATAAELNFVAGVTSAIQTQLDAKQPLDATLTALAGVATSADKLIYATGSDTFTTTDFSSFARTLVDDADAGTARTTLGLVAGGTGDIWVEKAGDTMTGQLLIDGGSDQIQLLVQGNATQTALLAVFENSAGTDQITFSATSAVVFNEAGNDADFRIEGDTDVNLIYVDASTDRVGIGVALPTQKLEVAGSIQSTGTQIVLDSSGTALFRVDRGANTNTGAYIFATAGTDRWNLGLVSGADHLQIRDAANGRNFLNLYTTGSSVFNEDGLDQDFRVEGDTDVNNIFSDASTDRVGIGTATPAEKLDVVGHAKVSGLSKIFNQSVADDTATGISASFTAGEALVLGDVCYMKSDGKMWKGDADAIATSSAVGIATASISADASGAFLLMGFLRDDSAYAWTVGGLLYLSTTPGAITQTAPSGTDDVIQVLGVALTADMIYFNPNLVQVEHV